MSKKTLMALQLRANSLALLKAIPPTVDQVARFELVEGARFGCFLALSLVREGWEG